VTSLRRLLGNYNGLEGERLKEDGGARKRKRVEITDDEDHIIAFTDSDHKKMGERVIIATISIKMVWSTTKHCSHFGGPTRRNQSAT
jgi:hypothetical protein